MHHIKGELRAWTACWWSQVMSVSDTKSHPGGHCTSRSPMTQADERIFIPWRPTVLLRHLGIGLDAWRRQDKVRQSQCIISVAVHPGKAACPPPLWDMRGGKACYQVSQVQDEPCVGCKPFRCHVWLGPHLSHQDRAKADVRGCGQQWSWGFEWEKMLEHEFFKARTFFFFTFVQYKRPQLLTVKYKQLCNKMRIITTGIVIPRKISEI